MDEAELQEIAFQHLTQRLHEADVADGVLRLCDEDTSDDDQQAAPFVQFRATVVRPATDFVVFYDSDGRLTGWRDDGRLGEVSSLPGSSAEARLKAMNELALPQGTRSGRHRAVELPHVGWVSETVLFTGDPPRDDQVLKIWSNPVTGQVVQWIAKSGQEPRLALGPAMGTHAGEVVKDVLMRRLRKFVSPLQPKWYFLVRAMDPELIAQGYQVRVQTWRHWSDAWVTLDPLDGLVCGDRIDRLCAPATTEHMEVSAAERALAAVFEPPPDAVLDQYFSEEFAEDHFVDTLQFRREINGIRVDGDYFEVSLHPQTKQLVRHDVHWRPASDVSVDSTISLEDAVRWVEEHRADIDLDPELEFSEGELAIVPARVGGAVQRAPQRPRAWCLTFEADWGYVIVQVHATSRDILHVQRSA